MAVWKLQQLLVEDETTFAENSESGTPTWTRNLPIFNLNTDGLTQDRIPDAAYTSRLAEMVAGHPGLRGGSFSFSTYWCGHGTTAATSLTESWFQELLGDALGGNLITTVGTTISGAASTANVLNVTAATNISAGSIVRVGIKGDGRGDGQALAVASSDTGPTPDTVTLLTNAPAAPTTAGDVVYAAQVAYFDEDATQKTKRFAFMHSGTGQQVMAFGCQLASVKFNIPLANELPTVDWTFNCATWRRLARTFPDAIALDSPYGAPVGGGSFFINDVGTATRATAEPAEISLDINLGLQPVLGPGALGTYSNITNWARTDFKAQLAVKIPWVTTYETWWDTANQSITYKHALFTANPTDGRSVGFYCPRLMPMGMRPSKSMNVNDQTYVDVVFGCREGATTTTDLERSSVRLFQG